RYEAAAGLNHPRRDDCWYYVGKNYLRMGREGPAAGAFERAGSLPGARFERTLLAARAGRGGEADAEARRLSEEFPDAYPPVSLRYRLALARNDRPAAARLADEFARRPRPLPTPLAAEITWVFGVANGVGRDRLFRDAGREARAGRLEAAEANLRAALAAGWSPEIADKLADILFALGRPGEADEVLAEAVSRGRPSFELLWRWGQAQDALGRPDRARELWERAARVATGPGAKGLWQDLAARYERAGDPGRARTFRARAHLAGGMESLGAGRPGEAAEALRRAVESDPSLAGAWYLLGEAARAAGRPGDARAAYEECLRLDPDNGRAVRALNLLAARGG
ncbi:MAG TPA: tetratricopeptide repeat protein, partial [Gemmataceae bacterium]